MTQQIRRKYLSGLMMNLLMTLILSTRQRYFCVPIPGEPEWLTSSELKLDYSDEIDICVESNESSGPIVTLKRQRSASNDSGNSSDDQSSRVQFQVRSNHPLILT